MQRFQISPQNSRGHVFDLANALVRPTELTLTGGLAKKV